MIAVITGDLINSRAFDDPGRWLEELKELLASVSTGPELWNIYRGDSFQVELVNPEDAFALVMKVKATIRSHKSLDVRMAIGIGEKSYAGANVTESNGTAFIHSGELLEHLKATKQSLAIRSPWQEWDREINASLHLSLVIMDQWKPQTARLVRTVMEHQGKSQQEIADLMQMQQAGVSQGLKRAHFSELMAWNDIFSHKLKTQLDIHATPH
jgi:hypothetical protein